MTRADPPRRPELAAEYVAARAVLLDALEALVPHARAVIVAGAQAVYLHAGSASVGIAPYTTDGDLALDPMLLDDEPALEDAMRAAGFHLVEREPSRAEPGTWIATTTVAGRPMSVPVDLIVPEGAATGGGRRGARLGPHGRRAARRAVGLEAALVDHRTMRVGALDPADPRCFDVQVATPAALLIAKAHKIHDRVATRRADRIGDKDAADVYRLMLVAEAGATGARLRELRVDARAGGATAVGLGHLGELFGGPGRVGTRMAARALRGAVPADRIEAVMPAYAARLLAAAT